MTKDIEKQSKKHPVVVTLIALVTLAGIVRLIVKALNSDNHTWEN